jgi:hypothetical protein
LRFVSLQAKLVPGLRNSSVRQPREARPLWNQWRTNALMGQLRFEVHHGYDHSSDHHYRPSVAVWRRLVRTWALVLGESPRAFRAYGAQQAPCVDATAAAACVDWGWAGRAIPGLQAVLCGWLSPKREQHELDNLSDRPRRSGSPRAFAVGLGLSRLPEGASARLELAAARSGRAVPTIKSWRTHRR